MSLARTERIGQRGARLLLFAKWLAATVIALSILATLLCSAAIYARQDRDILLTQDLVLPVASVAQHATSDLLKFRRIQQLWGGPTRAGDVRGEAGVCIVWGVAILGWGWLRHRRFAWTGLLPLLAAPLLVHFGDEGSTWAIPPPGFIRPGGFEYFLADLDRRQPGLRVTLTAGRRPVLPNRDERSFALHFMGSEGQLYEQVMANRPPIVDQREAEALRFALAQLAYHRQDVAALRRMLPLAPVLSDHDRQYSGNEIAQRLRGIGLMAGQPPVPPNYLPWLREASARWDRRARVATVLRLTFYPLMLIAAICAGFGIVLRRRYRRITAAAAPTAA